MAVSAALRVEMAWLCPECGHGSPEPRDRQAHLDAHRQLRHFIDAWDAAAAADQAAERRYGARPLYAVAVVLVVAALAALTYWGPGERAVVPSPPAGPAPGAELPPLEPPPPSRPPVPDPAPTPARAPSPPRTAPAGQVAVPAPPAADGDVPQDPVPAPPPAAPSVESALPTVAPPPPLVTVRGCVLVICVSLGG